MHLQHLVESIPLSSAQYVKDLLGNSWITSLAGLMQREASARGIIDTFFVSSIPLFICIPLVFFFLDKKAKKETNSVES